MPQHYGNKKKRKSGDPNLEPGLAAATKRAQRTRKATPKIDPIPRKKFKKMKAIVTPRHRKRTSDPNLEPGVTSATRRAQRTRKTASASQDIRKELEERPFHRQLVPNIGTPVPRRRVPEFPPAIGTDFPYGRPVTPRTVTPKPTRNRTGTTKRRRR